MKKTLVLRNFSDDMAYMTLMSKHTFQYPKVTPISPPGPKKPAAPATSPSR